MDQQQQWASALHQAQQQLRRTDSASSEAQTAALEKALRRGKNELRRACLAGHPSDVRRCLGALIQLRADQTALQYRILTEQYGKVEAAQRQALVKQYVGDCLSLIQATRQLAKNVTLFP